MRSLKFFFGNLIVALLFYCCKLFPLRRKVVATAFWGRIYGDNPRYIIEKLHELDTSIEIAWLKRTFADYDLPQWIKGVAPMSQDNNVMGIVKAVYEMATAKVWISSSGIPKGCKKRKEQLYIETYHGGLGIKRIMDDIQSEEVMKRVSVISTIKEADVLISQSDHLTDIYRRAFHYDGPVYKCGYPKNDIFFQENKTIIEKIRKDLRLGDKKVFLYIPTFRDYFNKDFDVTCYSVDFNQLKQALERKFGDTWVIMVKWHPVWTDRIRLHIQLPSDVMDISNYTNTQELLLIADAAMTDYSSAIFDAALRKIPCFTFATDFDEYKAERGVYYEMDELPFPNATTNEELIMNIEAYKHDDYLMRWDAFAQRMGLQETGHASDDIARKIIDFLDGKTINWN